MTNVYQQLQDEVSKAIQTAEDMRHKLKPKDQQITDLLERLRHVSILASHAQSDHQHTIKSYRSMMEPDMLAAYDEGYGMCWKCGAGLADLHCSNPVCSESEKVKS